jgi:hemolysin III
VPLALKHPFQRVDHIGIYLLIAGTVTPIALVVLRGRWRVGLLSGIWGLALAGIVLQFEVDVPMRVLTLMYVVMGWLGCASFFELTRLLGHARLRPPWLGGLFYTVGAVVELFYTVGAVIDTANWPVLVPGVFVSHELFHPFVMAGSLFRSAHGTYPEGEAGSAPLPLPPCVGEGTGGWGHKPRAVGAFPGRPPDA